MTNTYIVIITTGIALLATMAGKASYLRWKRRHVDPGELIGYGLSAAYMAAASSAFALALRSMAV